MRNCNGNAKVRPPPIPIIELHSNGEIGCASSWAVPSSLIGKTSAERHAASGKHLMNLDARPKRLTRQVTKAINRREQWQSEFRIWSQLPPSGSWPRRTV